MATTHARFAQTNHHKASSIIQPNTLACLLGVIACLPTSGFADVITTGDIDPAIIFSFEELVVGETATGTLTVDAGSVLNTSGGTLGERVSSHGTATITGIDSLWDARTTRSTGLHVGDRGTGTLNILDGAAVTHVGSNGRIGSEATGVGQVTIGGNGSSWSMDNFYIGDKGQGTLAIESGGMVSSDVGTIASVEGSIGTVTIDGTNSQWTNERWLLVGDEGDGQLHLSGGATVSNTWSGIGYTDSATGSVTVDGQGTTWTNTDTLTVGSFGTGHLAITNGGQVTSVEFARIGSHTTGTDSNGQPTFSTASIDGTGSSWAHAGDLFVGEYGNGQLTVRNGASLSNADGFIGFSINAIGQATVDGPEATWTNTGDLHVGYAGDGDLTIKNGGQVISENALMGFQANGTATITGTTPAPGSGSESNTQSETTTPSTWTVNDTLYLGGYFGGTARIDVTNGGLLDTKDTKLGIEPGGQGEIFVSGVGSKWINTGDLTIGVKSQGTVTVSDGGLLSIEGDLVLGENSGSIGKLILDGGILNLQGGSITPGDGVAQFFFESGTLENLGMLGMSLQQAGGTLAAGNSPGVLTIDGNYTQQAAATLEIELGAILQTAMADAASTDESMAFLDATLPGETFDVYDITGNAFLGGTLNLVGLDGYTPEFGDSFDVLQAAQIFDTGFTLAGLDGFEASIVTFGARDHLILTYVPEPAGLLGLALLAGPCVLRRRR